MSRHARGLMCLTGHPAIRTRCSHSLRGCGDLCRRCRRSGQGRDYRFLRRTAMPRWSFGISQIHGSVRAGDLRNLCSSYLLDFRSDMMRFSARVVERSADSSAHSIVCGRRSDSGASPDSHWPLHSAPSTQPDPTELVRSASLSLPEVRGLRTHSRWKNCQRRWSRLKPVLYFFERTMTKIQ